MRNKMPYRNNQYLNVLNIFLPMKKFTSTRLAAHIPALFCLVLLTATLQAQSPQISVQGTLKTASGTPAPDGEQTVTFLLYNVATGGTRLWEETANVDIVGGIYSHYLGSVTSLNASDFANTLYLAVKVGSYELSPRNRLAYAPYAFSVNTAQNALNAQNAQSAQTVVCSGAVGDIKYSILNPTQFASENGNCWVPMDGRSLASTDKLRIRTGMTSVPDGGGYFIRAQEYNLNIDDDRTASSPIAQPQAESFRQHNHSVSQTTISRMDGDSDGGNNRFDQGSGTSQQSLTIPPSNVTGNAGGTETRPDNLNFWIYIRIN